MYLSNTETYDLWSAARRQRRVLFALMLRNMRTKFFGNGLGYLVAVAWPLTHIVIIVAIFMVTGRVAPIGDSIALFIATGVVPFQTFNYLARFMMLQLIRSRPLLAFPEVKVLDMLFAAALLEILSACCVVIAFLVIAWFAGIDAMPRDIVQAAYALGACILLRPWIWSLEWRNCAGFSAVVHRLRAHHDSSLVVLRCLLRARCLAGGRPRSDWRGSRLVQVIEWMRSAYYEGYGGLVLDRGYVVGYAVVTIFLGLALERMLRGYILAKR